MIKVEKDVPMPRAHTPRLPYASYPWKAMEPDDSFLVPVGDDGRARRSVARAAYGAGKRYSTRYVTRTTPEGVRVWRVS